MSHAVSWTATAARALQGLPENVATAAVESIYGSLAEHPQRVGKPLRFGLEGLHSARRGDYRVVYEIDHQGDLVTIVGCCEMNVETLAWKEESRIGSFLGSSWRVPAR